MQIAEAETVLCDVFTALALACAHSCCCIAISAPALLGS